MTNPVPPRRLAASSGLALALTLAIAGAACSKSEPPPPATTATTTTATAALPSASAPAPSETAAASASAAPAPSEAASTAPSTTSTASASPAASASATAKPARTCGDKPLPPCPLYAWMKANTSAAMNGQDFDGLAKALDKVVTFAPAGYPNWASISRDGAAAARAQNVDGVKASCRSCHNQYKDKYKRDLRDRPI